MLNIRENQEQALTKAFFVGRVVRYILERSQNEGFQTLALQPKGAEVLNTLYEMVHENVESTVALCMIYGLAAHLCGKEAHAAVLLLGDGDDSEIESTLKKSGMLSLWELHQTGDGKGEIKCLSL